MKIFALGMRAHMWLYMNVFVCVCLCVSVCVLTSASASYSYCIVINGVISSKYIHIKSQAFQAVNMGRKTFTLRLDIIEHLLIAHTQNKRARVSCTAGFTFLFCFLFEAIEIFSETIWYSAFIFHSSLMHHCYSSAVFFSQYSFVYIPYCAALFNVFHLKNTKRDYTDNSHWFCGAQCSFSLISLQKCDFLMMSLSHFSPFYSTIFMVSLELCAWGFPRQVQKILCLWVIASAPIAPSVCCYQFFSPLICL